MARPFEGLPYSATGYEQIQVGEIFTNLDRDPKDGTAWVAPEMSDKAAISLVVQDYNTAVEYVNQQEWFGQWRDNDLLYQSPVLFDPSNATARVPRFTVNNDTNTLADAVKSGLFAQKPPFFLRKRGETTQEQLDAWTALLDVLCDRMNLPYWAGLGIASQTLQGTGIWKAGWSTRKRKVFKRRQAAKPVRLDMPAGSETVHTLDSDKHEAVPEVIEESYPWIEYRMLGTTLFDPAWRTPNKPEYAGYVIDIDFVNWHQLKDMGGMDCYKIPDLDELKDWLVERGQQSAELGTQIEANLSREGSPVMHAESRSRATSADPLSMPIMMLERRDRDRVMTVLKIDGYYVLIQNEEHGWQRGVHFAANWRNVENSGYGIGIGRLVGSDQRIEQGVLNHALNLLAYQFNPSILYALGSGNAPTGDRAVRAGGFMGVTPIGGDVRNALAVMEMPAVPAEAWNMIQYSKTSSQETSGADATFMQGQLQGRGSSAARTATGAARISAKSDGRVQTPVENVETGLVVPLLQLVMDMVRRYMPAKEIRSILSAKLGDAIGRDFDAEALMTAELEVEVLAGARLAAKAAMAQQLPYLMQVFQQPQLLEQLHEQGETVQLQVILDVLFAVSEYRMEDEIITPMTDKQMQAYQQSKMLAAGGGPKANTPLQVEQARGQNALELEDKKAQNNFATSLAEHALERAGGGIPLTHAGALVDRANDVKLLSGGAPAPLAGAN